MAVNLAWLLARPELDLELLAGSAGGVEIEWAHAIELEDPTPWLSGGELVLTTGLRFPRAALEQRQYVERLGRAGVAALAFGVGVRYAQVPKAVQTACLETDLPLLRVPLPTPFIAITQAIASRLAADQLATMQRALDHQRQSVRAALRQGVSGVVAAVSRELDSAVVLIDEYGVTLTSSTKDPELLDAAQAQRARLAKRPRTGSVSTSTDAGTLEVQTLRGRSTIRGYLAVHRAAPLRQADRLVLNQAIALIVLLLDRPRELVEAYRDLGSTALDLLLAADPAGPEAVAHLRHFGFDSADPVVVMAVIGHRRSSLFRLVADRLEESGRPRVVTTAESGAVVLVRSVDAQDLAQQLVAGFAATGRHDVVVGISAPVPQHRASTALVPAEQAAAAGRRQRKQIGRFEDLTLQAVLADDTVRSRIEALARPALAPLVDSPIRRDQELVASLDAFLRHNGSWESAARALGIHRHTLRSHISRVEELTGLNLDVADHRVVLLLALMTQPTSAGSS